MRRAGVPIFLFLAGAWVTAVAGQPPTGSASVWVLRNARIVPVAAAPIPRGEILVRGDRIEAVGAQVTVPPGATVVDAEGATVYPGLIDGYTTLAQPQSIPSDRAPRPAPQPSLATPEAQLQAVAGGVTPEWRVATVVQTPALTTPLAVGITTALTLPRTGPLPGRGAWIVTQASSGEAALIGGPEPLLAQFTPPGGRYPSTVMGTIAAIRQALADGARYRDHGVAPEPEARSAALAEALTGSAPLLFHAPREIALRAALIVSREFGLRPLLITGPDAVGFIPALREQAAGVLFSLGSALPPARANRSDPAAAPAALHRAGIPLVLTSEGLANYAGFFRAVRRVIAAGLPEEEALRALTVRPAELMGIADRVGAIRPGLLANLVVATGPLFDANTRIRRVYIRGEAVEPGEPPPDPPAPANEAGPTANGPLPSLPPTPRTLLIRGGTLLTVTRGTIPNGSILIQDGKIVAVVPAARITAPSDALVIDASGKYVMPGIIDAHSHMAISGGINESTHNITCEVRIRDVINPRDVSIYRALAGGVTTIHTMHGSANVIGGQNAILKLRWGRPAEEMLVANAPRTVKFALGENPVAYATGGRGAQQGTRRYPGTRMGQEYLLRLAFTEARRYRDEWAKWRPGSGPPPRRDLRLEALVDIMEGRILVQAHSYRADEILALMRVAEEFGFRIRTLHHALEAYKIAPEIARHGAGVSTFADNWAYKVEAYDAIPHNAALCARAGVRVSVNSDSDDRVRRLNWEAAKCMRYGGMSEEEALRTITLHPAWQIGMEHRIGSLEPGKDADIAIFSAHPFAANARCEMTLIEGQIYFSREHDAKMRGHPDYPGEAAQPGNRIVTCCDEERHLLSLREHR